MILPELFLGFLRVGCFSLGGSYAAVPLIREVVLAHGWLDEEMLTYMIAVSESTPGPIMVNLATYVGSSQAGLAGAAAATLAVVLPAFLIILLLMNLFSAVIRRPAVRAVFRGLTPCVIGVILATGAHMILLHGFVFSDGALRLRPLILTVVLAAVYFGARKVRKGGISPILLICLSAAAGIAAYGI